ncbi:MAG: histone deacetylase [Bryobacteraceae bacterium]
MTALAADPIARTHQTGSGHPERPERFDAAVAALRDMRLTRLAPRAATEAELMLVHTRSYVTLVREETESGTRELSTGDTAIGPGTWPAALHAVGAALNAVDAVLEGKARNALCLVRPPGHHAAPGWGMGFCVFNNVAIAARYARRQHGIARVLIADWDVHHGNGTEETFQGDSPVLFFSTHQSPWYPGTGLKSGANVINCPFPAGAGGREILGAFREKLVPAAEKFKPELVLVSAGFDSREGDPLGRFRLTDADFAEMTRILSRFAGGRVVSVLEGGYNLAGLAAAVRAHAEVLTEYSAKGGESS